MEDGHRRYMGVYFANDRRLLSIKRLVSLQNYLLRTILSTPTTTRRLHLTSDCAVLISFNSYGDVLVSAEHAEVN